MNLVITGANINDTAYVYVIATATASSKNYSDSLVKYARIVNQGFK